jgi:hypothetical protein
MKVAPAEELQQLLHYEIQLFVTNRVAIATTMYALYEYLTTQPVCSTQNFDPATSLQLPHLALRTAFCFDSLEQSNPIRSEAEKRCALYRMPPMITGCPKN